MSTHYICMHAGNRTVFHAVISWHFVTRKSTNHHFQIINENQELRCIQALNEPSNHRWTKTNQRLYTKISTANLLRLPGLSFTHAAHYYKAVKGCCCWWYTSAFPTSSSSIVINSSYTHLAAIWHNYYTRKWKRANLTSQSLVISAIDEVWRIFSPLSN